jgi:CRISPR system Cascade subunit CasC
MSVFVDFYALQAMAPNNINRDDMGSPKTARFGGELRARVSSQAWKRAMRNEFDQMLPTMDLGVRTRRAPSLIASAITAKKPELEESSNEIAAWILSAAGIDVRASDRAGDESGEQVTGYLLFIAEHEVEALADLAIALLDEGADYSKKPDSKIKKRIKEIFLGNQAVDIALFGRMLADAPDLNTDASAQVAHAISVNKIEPEYDYFTAVDDAADEDNAGAAMISTTGFNSSTLYRYATVNASSLASQLGDIQASAKTVSAFATAFLRSMPTGKQNSFANRNLPEFCLAVVRTTQPINLVSAFEEAITVDENESITRQAIAKLANELKDIEKVYGDTHVAAFSMVVGDPVAELDGISESVSLPQMSEKLTDVVENQLNSEEQA